MYEELDGKNYEVVDTVISDGSVAILIKKPCYSKNIHGKEETAPYTLIQTREGHDTTFLPRWGNIIL